MPGDPAVFIDRDGTLTEEVGYVNHPRRLRLLPRSAEALRRLNRSGLKAVMVTNQSGEGEPPYRAVCDCRKPEPGLLRRAAADLGLDLSRSWMVGDKVSDVEWIRARGER